MKLEGRASRLLLCPVLQTAGQRQRQFPQHALEPHAADQNTHHADANVPAGALRRIVLPVLNGDSHAGEHQYPEQGKDQKAPTSEVEIVARRRGQELPSVGERIFWHARLIHGPGRTKVKRFAETLMPRARLLRHYGQCGHGFFGVFEAECG